MSFPFLTFCSSQKETISPSAHKRQLLMIIRTKFKILMASVSVCLSVQAFLKHVYLWHALMLCFSSLKQNFSISERLKCLFKLHLFAINSIRLSLAYLFTTLSCLIELILVYIHFFYGLIGLFSNME